MLWRDPTYTQKGLRGQNVVATRERSCRASEPHAARTKQSIILRGDSFASWTQDHAQKIWRKAWRNCYMRSTVIANDP